MNRQQMLQNPEQTWQTIGTHMRQMHVHDGKYREGKVQVGLVGWGVIGLGQPVDLFRWDH